MIIWANVCYNLSTRKLLAFKVCDELEHTYVHAHTVTVDVLQYIQADAEKGEGIWSSLFVVGKKQLATFSTTKETVVDCKFAVVVLRYSH